MSPHQTEDAMAALTFPDFLMVKIKKLHKKHRCGSRIKTQHWINLIIFLSDSVLFKSCSNYSVGSLCPFESLTKCNWSSSVWLERVGGLIFKIIEPRNFWLMKVNVFDPLLSDTTIFSTANLDETENWYAEPLELQSCNLEISTLSFIIH